MDDLTLPSLSTPGPRCLDERSLDLRRRIVRHLHGVRRGHIGSAFSIIEILRVLYDRILRFDSARPRWPERDRFIMSKGHGCLALYEILADKGFFPAEELSRISTASCILGGHPDYAKVPGVEASTGSLGHGLSIGVGIALSGRLDQRDYRTIVLVGDGECQEGTVWEAALAASKHRLQRLAVLVDCNRMQCYASTAEVLDLEPLADKWKSFGFAVREVDGHDPLALERALGALPYDESRPSCLICHTVKGKGIPQLENNPDWHHKSRITDEQMTMLCQALGMEFACDKPA